MFPQPPPPVSSSLARTIEDAIMLGSAKDLEDILALVKDDPEFPQSLRYGLEGLMFYRRYYGNGGDLEPRDPAAKKRAVEMEVVWGKELLNSLETFTESAQLDLTRKFL